MRGGDVRKSGIAIVVAATLGLAACGSAGPSQTVTNTTVPVGRKIVLTSITTTAAAQTARIAMEMNVTADPSLGSISSTGDGVTDFGTGDTDVAVQYERATGASIGGAEVRSVGGVVYVRVPSQTSLSLPPGKSWIATDSTNDAVSVRSPFDFGGQSDPSKALAYLESVSNDVHVVGSEQIRGVDTTHYAATIDLAKSIDLSHVPSGLRDSAKALVGLEGSIPADVWIDGDGRLRRERLRIDLDQIFRAFDPSDASNGHDVVMTETLDLYDFGTPVHVESPPADQVMHVSSPSDLPTLNGNANP